jgi:hypothetical protein
MAPKTFRATLEQSGTPLIEVPAKIVESFGGRKRLPVKVTLNGFTFRTTIAVYGGRYYIGVNKKNREESRVEAGQTITVKVDVDTDERKVTPPPELARAFRRNAGARRFFDTLSFTHQREYAEWVAEARQLETRRRRAERAVEMLAEGRQTR